MATNFIAEAWSELAIALVFICLRLYFRLTQTGWRGMTWDDLLMVFAGVSTMVFQHFVLYYRIANMSLPRTVALYL